MEELESSGLLADDAAATPSDAGAALPGPGPASAEHAVAADAGDRPHTPPGVDEAHGGDAAYRAGDAGSGPEGRTDSGVEPRERADADSAAQPDGGGRADAGGDGTGGDDGDQAEQRVLGDLAGVDGWFEVMDMASRKARRSAPSLPLLPPTHQVQDATSCGSISECWRCGLKQSCAACRPCWSSRCPSSRP